MSEKKQKKVENFLDDLKRVQADFVNYKKRVEEEKKQWLKFANVGLINKLLPILNNFERASEHLPKDLSENEFVKGLMGIEAQFFQLMKEEGVERIEAKGEFDPKWHEVVMSQESDEPEGVILEELEAGYKIGDTVLIASKVKVSKGAK